MKTTLKNINNTLKSVIFILLVSITIITVSCENKENVSSDSNKNNDAQMATISGEMIDGAGLKIILYAFQDDRPAPIDSTVIANDGTFKFTLPLSGYAFMGVGENFNQAALILIKKGSNITLRGALENWNLNFQIEGSEETEILTEYYVKRYAFGMKMQELQMEANSLDVNDTKRKSEIQKESENLIATFDSYKYDFIENNINSPAVFIAYADIYDLKNDYEILERIEATMKVHMPNSQFTKAVGDKAKQGKSLYEESLKQAEQEKIMAAQMQQSGLGIGLPAPEIALPNPDGKIIKLSSLKGKVVLLDFWASWCKPCRMENPNVVRLYNKYKNKGFTVYSVSLDNQKENWVSAIQQDGLEWTNHVSDLKGWQSSAGAIYMVNSIPQTFLIDTHGKIIDVGIRGVELKQALIQLFGN